MAQETLKLLTEITEQGRRRSAALRQHLQLQMTDAATCKEAREKVLAYEGTTTSWLHGDPKPAMESVPSPRTPDHDKDEAIPILLFSCRFLAALAHPVSALLSISPLPCPGMFSCGYECNTMM